MATRESRPHLHHPDPVLITLTEPKSAASEAFRTLRTNIQFAGLDQPCRSIALSIAGGLVLAIGAAFALERLDTTVKTPDDVERYLGLSVIGVVPSFLARRR